MGKSNKGLAIDVRPVNQPPGTYPFAKNGVVDNFKDSNENEPGFTLSPALLPYPYMGVISSDKHAIIFSTNNTNSAIGYYDEINDVYIPILNDASMPFLLGFNTANYITGEAQRNYKGEVVVVWTDKVLPPKYVNCDNPVANQPEDILLFPLAQAPTITLTQDVGGSLLPGSYFAAVRYLKNDGTQTAFLTTSTPTIVAGAANVAQNISLIITLTNVDPNYDIAEIAIIQKVGGVFTAYLLDQVQLAATTTATYTGSNPTTTVTLDEILQNPIVYQKVGTFGQLNDYLYAGNLEAVPEINMQQYANMIKVKWASELHNVFPADPDITSGRKKGHMHREVYCLYAQFSLNTGGWSRAFNIPGRAPFSNDLLNSGTAAIGGVTARHYQVDDTIPTFDPVSKTGEMGCWINQTETYPNTDDYNSTAIGGEDLRGQQVRHHRMPSLRWCKQNLYQTEAEYGKSKLDILGLSITNILIPAKYAGTITGYRILYAQRNLGNSTVIAQAQYLNGSRASHNTQYDPATQSMNGPFDNFISSGGNWRTEDHTQDPRPLYTDLRIVRFHAFDLLFNQPAITPSYICNELQLQLINFHNPDTNGFMINNGSIPPGTENGPLTLLADYLTKGVTPVSSSNQQMIRKVTDSTYVPANLVNGKWNNIMQETCFGMVVSGPEVLHIGVAGTDPANDPTTDYGYNKLLLHSDGQHPGYLPKWEKTFLMNLMYLRDNLYVAFTSQTLVIAGDRVPGASNALLFGGDTFINDYTFHTYGWMDAQNDGYTHFNQPLTGGIRVARRFACEAASNINLRFETPGNQYSEWYPKQPLVVGSATNYLTLYDRTNDPNQFGYSKDLNALNELVSSAIFTPLIDQVTLFPYRIHRSGKLGRLDKRRSWRTFDPLDFYEMQKNMGTIINLEGQDDRLLIHMEKALFATQDKTKLESNVLSITLGAGDIFQFEPQEAQSSKLGYAGTQHDLSCVRTPMGYVFVDSLQGQVFLLKGKLRLLNELLNTFFRQWARTPDKNIFIGNGYTFGYDPVYRRILFTAKNQVSNSAGPVLIYQATPEFIATLTPGVSLVYKDGRVQRFLGVNTNPVYSCPSTTVPAIPNYTLSVNDNTLVGTQVFQTGGVNVDDVYILSGNTSNAFALTTDGKLSVNGYLDFYTQNLYVLNCLAANDDGQNTAFTITIHIIATNKPPTVGDQTVHVNDQSPAGTAITQVIAVDPEAQPLTYTIVAGNDANAFAVDGSGNITVLTQAAIDLSVRPGFTLTVAVSDGVNTVDATIIIIIDYINTPPSSNDVVITIPDTTATGAQIVDLSIAVTDTGVTLGLETLTFTVLTESVPGVFAVDGTTGHVTLVSNAALNPSTTPQYILTLRAQDNGSPPLGSNFRLIVNVTYDPGTIAFAPAQSSCTGGTCPAGYALSPDGTMCVQTTQYNATSPSGPQILAVAAVNTAYSDFGILVYQAGYALNGTGTIQQQINAFPWNNPSNNLLDGAQNRCGVWGSPSVPDNQPIGFSIPVFLPTAKTYLVAIAGDNKVQISLNGIVIVDQDPTAMAASIGTQLPVFAGQGIAVAFKFWHVYPVALPAGNSYIGLQGVNFGGAAGFGAEIYDNTIADLVAAQLDPAYIASPGTFPTTSNHYSNLNLIFSTRAGRNVNFTSGVNNAYSCPGGGGLDPTQTPPQCVVINSIPAVPNTEHWAKVAVSSTRLGVQVALLNNVMSQTFQGIPVPYYADVVNAQACGGTIQTFLNVQKTNTLNKDDCPVGQIGSIVSYYVQAGRYMSLVSQADADALAQTDVDSNTQTYANSNGTCSLTG